MVEFFRGKVKNCGILRGVRVKNRGTLQGQNPYFSQNCVGANKDCMEFLRGYHIISKNS